jgi:hypothetical protein
MPTLKEKIDSVLELLMKTRKELAELELMLNSHNRHAPSQENPVQPVGSPTKSAKPAE